MWILSMALSVSILIEFHSINILRKLAHSTKKYKVVPFAYKSWH